MSASRVQRRMERKFRDTHTRLASPGGAAPSFGAHPPTFYAPPPISTFLEHGEVSEPRATPEMLTRKCSCCGEHALKVVVMQFEACDGCGTEYVGKVR